MTLVPLRDAAAARPWVEALGAALEADDRRAVQRACNGLGAQLCADLEISAVPVRVLARRPADAVSELHGLYLRHEDGSTQIRVWMRTAAHERVVAFRTFLRTLLHELCHHLDYEHLELADSYHTQGFFQRESSLARQLLPEPRRRRRGASPQAEAADAPAPRRRRRADATAEHEPGQLVLPGLDDA